MKAQDLQFAQLLEGSKPFISPIFQQSKATVRSFGTTLFVYDGSALYVDAVIPRWLIAEVEDYYLRNRYGKLSDVAHLDGQGVSRHPGTVGWCLLSHADGSLSGLPARTDHSGGVSRRPAYG